MSVAKATKAPKPKQRATRPVAVVPGEQNG